MTKNTTPDSLHEHRDQLRISLTASVTTPRVIIWAVSGGADSMCAYHSGQRRLASRGHDMVSIVVHCNHRTRPQTDDEEQMVLDYVRDGAEFHAFRYRGSEQSERAWRVWRRQCIERVVSSVSTIGPVIVVTGHHLDDRIETSLLHLYRGCGHRGLTNMTMSDQRMLSGGRGSYTIVRPLLTTTKESIMCYCEQQSVPFVVDETNRDHRGGLRSVMRHVLHAAMVRGSDAEWYGSWQDIYDGFGQYQHMVMNSFVLQCCRCSQYWPVDDLYRVQSCGAAVDLQWITADVLLAVIQQLSIHVTMTSATLDELLSWIGHSDAGYVQVGRLMWVLAHGQLYVFVLSEEGLAMDQPFWESKPIANSLLLTSVGRVRYGDCEIDVTDEMLGACLRYAHEGDSLGSRTLMRVMSRQQVPVFWRNYVPIVERDGVIEQVLLECVGL